MKNITSIHQPGYFPWLGLLDKINKSDTFVLLDNVQLNDNSYQSRNIFLNCNGSIQYLTIPIQKKDYQKKMIKELKVIDNKWQKKHNGYFIANYKKHTYFDEIYPKIKSLYEKKYDYLIDIIYDSMIICNNLFDIKTNIIFASSLDLDTSLVKDDLVIDILKKVNATKYISGTGAKDYQEDNKFSNYGIELEYQSFSLVKYKQKNSQNFEFGLSSLDILFNLGKDNSIKILNGVLS